MTLLVLVLARARLLVVLEAREARLAPGLAGPEQLPALAALELGADHLRLLLLGRRAEPRDGRGGRLGGLVVVQAAAGAQGDLAGRVLAGRVPELRRELAVLVLFDARGQRPRRSSRAA